jgi:hypothetical protein
MYHVCLEMSMNLGWDYSYARICKTQNFTGIPNMKFLLTSLTGVGHLI